AQGRRRAVPHLRLAGASLGQGAAHHEHVSPAQHDRQGGDRHLDQGLDRLGRKRDEEDSRRLARASQAHGGQSRGDWRNWRPPGVGGPGTGAARPRGDPGAGLRHPGPAPPAPARGLSLRGGALLIDVQRLHRPAERVHRPPQLHQALGERRLPADLPERVRLYRDRGGVQGGDGHHPGPAPQRTALVQAHDPRRGPAAVGDPDRAQHARLVVDVQLALQRGELDRHRHRAHGSARPELARPAVLRDGRGHHGQHLAGAPVLRHNHPRGPGGHPEGALRGGGGRRGRGERPLLAQHASAPQAGARGGGALLHHLHLQRLQHRLRAHPRRAHQLHPPLRHPVAHDRHRHRADRRGRGDLALPLPAARLRGLGPAPLRAEADLLTVARRPFLGKVAKHLLLLPFLVFALFPFYHMTLTSLKQDRELYDRFAVPLIITQGPTLEHYTKLLWDTEFLTWTKNSLLVTVLATSVSIVIGTIAAYALARLKFFGVGAFGTGIFVTYLVPTSLLFLPLAQVINWLGIADSKWALVLTYPTFL